MLFVYQLKVGVCLIGFYLVLKLLLGRETFHHLYRAMLLAAVPLSLLLPLVHVNSDEPSALGQGLIIIEGVFAEVQQPTGEALQASSALSSGIRLAYIIYMIGLAVVVLWHVASQVRLWKLLRQGRVERMPDGTWLHILPGGKLAPFSYFRHIVISQQDYDENPREILTHEQAHIAHWHSADVLLSNLLVALQWWNPAAWLLRRELQQVHEYEADEAVLERGVDARQYQLLLIRKSVGEQLFSMANNFNHQSLKKRIRMMTRKKSSEWKKLRLVAILPMAALVMVAFASPSVERVASQVELSVSSQQEQLQTVAPSDTARVYDKVEVMPEFPGGMQAMMRFISDNIRYPKDAKEAKKEGRSLVEFVIETDGSITDVSVVKEVYPSIDEEAIRVVKSMPKWTPGEQDGKKVRVKFMMPITFKLQGSSENKTVPLEIIPTGGKGNGPDPLFIVDGKEVSSDVVIKIDSKTIESITVLKDKAAVEVYGAKGKNGVVEVKLKK